MIVWCGCLCSMLIIVGCGRPDVVSVTPRPTPTLSSFFNVTTPIPTHALADLDEPIPIIRPNATVIAQATITALDDRALETVVVYDDVLQPGWSLEQSFQTDIDVRNRTYVKKGRYAIRAKPLYTTGTLYFTVDRTAKEPFLRSRVQGIRFYLSGGGQPINNDVLTVAVVGSNAYPYWVEKDDSVEFEGRVTDNDPIFSETQLVFLGINQSIPSRTYVEVTVWLDSLIYDPTYQYVTGFYLKTDKEFVPTFYVDAVSVLLLPE